MFHVKNHKQLHIFDPWGHIGPKRLKLLEDSWARVIPQGNPHRTSCRDLEKALPRQ